MIWNRRNTTVKIAHFFFTFTVKQESLYLPVERIFMSAWYGLASLIPAVSMTSLKRNVFIFEILV